MQFHETIALPVTEADVKQAIQQALAHHFIDNLRHRSPNVAFDSKLRGYVGEIALKNWFRSQGIDVTTRNYIPDGANIDIDFAYHGLDIELKTSLVPDADQTLENAFARRDLKLICRGKPSVAYLKGDVHVQIFYNHRRKQKDTWLQAQRIPLESKNVETIYDAILGKSYIRHTYLFGWIDKATLVKRLEAMPATQRTWAYAQRTFWKCPLSSCFPPDQLIAYLQQQGNC